MKKRIKFITNDQGIALVMVLLALTVIVILGLALMGLTLNNVKMSTGERNYQSAYYIAESGITYTTNNLNKNVVAIYNNSNNESDFFSNIENLVTNINNESPIDTFEDSFGHKPEAKISIEESVNNNSDTNYRDYKITSTGTIDNFSRAVEKQIRITWVPKNNVPGNAVFVQETINLSGGAKIDGGAGTNLSAPSSININGGASISGDIYVGPESGNDVINKPDWMNINNNIIKLSHVYTFDMPPFPDFPSCSKPQSDNAIQDGSLQVDHWDVNNYSLNMTQDMQITNIDINSNYTLNINVGDNNRNLVVDNLNLPNGKINIIGTGKLTIYVNNEINMGAGSIISSADTDVKKLDIFYKGSSLNLSGSQKIYGSLYAQSAEITMSGGSGFQGTIITGGNNVTIRGGANANTQFFYAPNANINISGGGSIKGSIIAKSYTASGGSTVTLDNFNVADLPPILGGTSGGNLSAKDIVSTQPTREK